MTNPESEAHQHWPSRRILIAGEDHPPISVRLREIGLHASTQPRSVAGLGVTGQELPDRDAIAFEPRSLSLGSPASVA